MKKYMIVFAFLNFALFGVGQNTFTQATFQEILDEYKKDSKAFFISRLSDDFRYCNDQGKFFRKSDITKNETQKIVTTEILEPVIFQSCDLATVSGIHKTARIEPDGKQVSSQVGFTYTFQKRNDKWMFVGSQQTRLPL